MSKRKIAVIVVVCIIGIIVGIVITTLNKHTPTQTYTLTINTSPSDEGCYVRPSGGEYESGVQVTLTAHPYGAYTFKNWSGSASGNTSIITITMDSDKNITAHFERIPIAR